MLLKANLISFLLEQDVEDTGMQQHPINMEASTSDLSVLSPTMLDSGPRSSNCTAENVSTMCRVQNTTPSYT